MSKLIGFSVLLCSQVQYLHPKDGVYPEKGNAGRQQVNTNKGRIGENTQPVQVLDLKLCTSSVQLNALDWFHFIMETFRTRLATSHHVDSCTQNLGGRMVGQLLDGRLRVSLNPLVFVAAQIKFSGKLGTYDK